MKNYKNLAPLVLLFLMAIAAYSVFNSYTVDKKQHLEYLKEARENAKLGIVEDALEQYNQALNMKDDIEIRLEAGNVYTENEMDREAIRWGEELVDRYPTDAKAYTYLLKQYIAKEAYESCFSLNAKAVKREAVNKEFTQLIQGIEYYYSIGFDYFEDVSCYGGELCAVSKEGTWGYVNLTGSVMIGRQFQQAGAFLGELAAVLDMEGDWYYISKEGNKKMVVQDLDKCTFLGAVNDSLLMAADNDAYAFYDTDFKKRSDSYQAASSMNYGIAAVKKNEKWGFLSADLKEVTKVVYDEVIFDEKQTVYRNDRAFAKREGKCYMVTGEGTEVKTEDFEDARSFAAADSYAAVCVGGKWGFMDKKGKMEIEPQYEDARSFANGLAAVKKDGTWGFVDSANNPVIENQFEEAKDFNSQGCVFIKQDGYWKLLKLYKYNY